MKFTLILLVFTAIFAMAFGADCEFKGGSYKKGEKFYMSGNCVEYTCDGPGAISAKGCPAEQSLKPCKYTATDNSKPYPQCCPRFDC